MFWVVLWTVFLMERIERGKFRQGEDQRVCRRNFEPHPGLCGDSVLPFSMAHTNREVLSWFMVGAVSCVFGEFFCMRQVFSSRRIPSARMLIPSGESRSSTDTASASQTSIQIVVPRAKHRGTRLSSNAHWRRSIKRLDNHLR